MDLSEALAALAVELPGVLLDEIAGAIEAIAAPGVRAAGAISRNVTQPRARGLALELCSAWESSAPGVSGAALALSLRACAATAHSIRGAQSVELAWTGPPTAVPLRKTREALRDLTKNAQSSLILVSFSAYRDDDITAQLEEAAARGVELTLILETTADSRGGLDREARDAFDALADKASFYSWPATQRVVGTSSLMHVKAAIADKSAALVGSANLSAAAMERNMELGVLIVGEPLPRLLERHVRLLIANDELCQIRR
ncbi:MAG TPA: DISARM system phospholipase D-like protein DrmC [Acidimicrobiales bacterium]|nr:DISARM system phospholipase D-like protein DrmC [Acidimicrobiales bacterium]